METTQLALLALLLGAAIGSLVSIVIMASLRARDRLNAESSEVVPVGVAHVLHGMDDAAAVVDASFTILAASAQAAPFGLVEGSVLPGEELKAVARRARSGESAATATLRLRRGAPPAEPRLVVVRATRISPRFSFLVLRDITEKERVEQMRRDFVANTSHELKTPVGAVSLLAEAIESAADDPAQVRIFTARLSAEAARLAGLTSRIMNLSRLQAADELTVDREVAVDEIVASALEAHAIQADSAGVTVTRGGVRGSLRAGRRADPQRGASATSSPMRSSYSPSGSSVGVGVKTTDRIVEIAVDGPGDRHPRGRAGARVRALLPCRSGALAPHRRNGPRALDRQARRAAPWR